MLSPIRYLFPFVLTLISFLGLAQNDSCSTTWYHGDGTFYGGVAGGSGGNCTLPVEEDDFYHAAMNEIQYDDGNACGACVKIFGPNYSITLKIVDRCPECLPGDIDLSEQAFAQIANPIDGRVPISWYYVPCPDSKTISIAYHESMNPYFFRAQIRNHRYAIKELAFRNASGNYISIDRENYNAFVYAGGIDEDKSQYGPYAFKITSIHDQEIEVENVAFTEDGEVDLNVQFPVLKCEDCTGELSGTAVKDVCGNCTLGSTGAYPITDLDACITGILEETEETLLIYPNPLKDVLHINYNQEYQAVLKDGMGKTVTSFSHPATEMNTTDLPTGIYFLEVATKDKTSIVKLVKD